MRDVYFSLSVTSRVSATFPLLKPTGSSLLSARVEPLRAATLQLLWWPLDTGTDLSSPKGHGDGMAGGVCASRVKTSHLGNRLLQPPPLVGVLPNPRPSRPTTRPNRVRGRALKGLQHHILDEAEKKYHALQMEAGYDSGRSDSELSGKWQMIDPDFLLPAELMRQRVLSDHCE